MHIGYNSRVALDDAQLAMAQTRLAQLHGELTLELHMGPDPDDRLGQLLVQVVGQLAQVAGDKLRLTTLHGDTPHPCLRTANIEYLAVPLDREFEPFLDILGYLDHGADPASPSIRPAALELMMAPTCPNCPTMVRLCGRLAAALPQIQLQVIDVQYFTELARSCRSVPTLIVDGALTVVGEVGFDELLRLLQQRDEPDHLVRALSSMIEARRLGEMGPHLLSDEGHAALTTIMRDGTMQQKMGLMLAVEAMLELQPHALDGAVLHLLPLLESEVATLRGDAADLLGRIGAPGERDALTRLLADENPDVREAAEEALDQLREPS